jgi:hypothetical protein
MTIDQFSILNSQSSSALGEMCPSGKTRDAHAHFLSGNRNLFANAPLCHLCHLWQESPVALADA